MLINLHLIHLNCPVFSSCETWTSRITKLNFYCKLKIRIHRPFCPWIFFPSSFSSFSLNGVHRHLLILLYHVNNVCNGCKLE